VIRSIVAVVAVVLVAASVSGATEQPPEPLETTLPGPHFGAAVTGPFSMKGVERRLRPLGSGAPPWAKRLYRRSVRVLVDLTDPQTGAMIAGERDGWDYVWPRDAGAGAIALQAAGLHPEAALVASFLSTVDTDTAARFHPDGSPVPGRPAAGDGEGWIAAASGAVVAGARDRSFTWRNRQDYGENVTGDLLGNAIASNAPPAEIISRFATSRGLVRQEGSDELDSAAAWAVAVFPRPGLRGAVRKTLLALTRESTPFGISPIEGWTPGQVWTAPTAWSACALADLGEIPAADRLFAELHRAETRYGTLPERVDAATGTPTSTTPLAWSHAFAILALRARYG
jgi:hypothetical protein